MAIGHRGPNGRSATANANATDDERATIRVLRTAVPTVRARMYKVPIVRENYAATSVRICNHYAFSLSYSATSI